MFRLILLCIFVSFSALAVQPEHGTIFTEKPLISSKQHMVVTAHPRATEAALSILEQEGNALDAAIAAQMVLGVVEPQSSGIGGGGFLLFYDALHRKSFVYDGREIAPSAVDSNVFLSQSGAPLPFMDAVQTGHSIGVPGLVAMLEMAHQQHGSLAWKRLFTAGQTIAENGFEVSPRLASLLESAAQKQRIIPLFQTEQGMLQKGAFFRNVQLAKSYEAIARYGSKAFYQGDVAKQIIHAVQQAPGAGAMSLTDLKRYQPKQRTLLCHPYRKYRICGMPPPSSGGVSLMQILGVMEQFDLTGLSPRSAEFIHLFAQATERAYRDRARYIADPDYVTVPVSGMLDKQYLMGLAESIDQTRLLQKGAIHAQEMPSTTHISIVDKEGNAVSMTTSIEHAFGSGRSAAGFLLNNQLTDFSFVSEKQGKKRANRLEPGKRPRSSMAPSFVFNQQGDLILVLGSPGGARIIPYVAQTIMAVLDFGLDIKQAVHLPHVVYLNNRLEIEAKRQLDEAVINTLKEMGYTIKRRDLNSGLAVIAVDKQILYGVADPRREGVAAGM